MWCGGYFNGQVLLWSEPSPIFSGTKEKQKFYNGANGHFLLCDAKYEKPPMVIGEIIEDICHTGDFH